MKISRIIKTIFMADFVAGLLIAIKKIFKSKKTINYPFEKGKIINFEIDSFKKKCLLNGLDDISLSLEKSDKISSYEENLKKTKSWANRYDES